MTEVNWQDSNLKKFKNVFVFVGESAEVTKLQITAVFSVFNFNNKKFTDAYL